MKRSSAPAQTEPPFSPWEVPANWKWVVVNQAGRVQVGKQLTRQRRPGDTLRKYVRAANITAEGIDLNGLLEMGVTDAEMDRFSLQPDDVVMTEASGSAAHVGRAAIWRGEIPDCCFQNTVIRFRPHLVIADYALRVFRYYSVAGIFGRVARGVGIQHLGAERLSALPFPLPPWEEQKRIVAEVQRRSRGIVDARTSLQSALRHLDEKVSAVLEAAATGQLVRATPLVKKSPGDPEVEPDTTNDPLHVPKHWRVVHVDAAGSVKLGRQRSPKYERGANMMPYLRVANVFEDRIDSSDLLKMNFTPKEQEVYKLRRGDILLNEGQSFELVGRPAMYRGHPSGVFFQKTLIRFRAHPDVEPRFALIVFRHYFRSGALRKIAQASTNIAHLTASRFSRLPFPVPPLAEQREIAERAEEELEECRTQTAAVQQSLAKLAPAELELLTAALAGSLVSSKTTDETAEGLVHRLGLAVLVAKKSPHSSAKRPVMKPRKTTEDLHAVLKAAGGKLTAEELFEAAGYDRDSSEDIEKFYLRLRSGLNKGIRQREPKNGHPMLEAN